MLLVRRMVILLDSLKVMRLVPVMVIVMEIVWDSLLVKGLGNMLVFLLDNVLVTVKEPMLENKTVALMVSCLG